MEIDVKREARRQYFKYFKVWFIIAAVLAVIGMLVVGVNLAGASGADNNEAVEQGDGRTNTAAPKERVYDLADVLTTQEEDALRAYISQKEQQIRADIVLVTINQQMETFSVDWETAMRDYADDFYDQNRFGYDYEQGSGVLLLDNWYDGQAGSWLSTCGNVYIQFGDYEINRVLDEVYYAIDNGAYEAYLAYVDTVCLLMEQNEGYEEEVGFAAGFVLFVPFIIALIYALCNLNQKKAKDTTVATTYVAGGHPVMNVKQDQFIRKSVTKRRIETNSGSSGGSVRSGGRGGSHRSSGGVSHGGGGRRR